MSECTCHINAPCSWCTRDRTEEEAVNPNCEYCEGSGVDPDDGEDCPKCIEWFEAETHFDKKEDKDPLV